MTKKNDQNIKTARKNLKIAEENQAIGDEFMGDYLELQGVRFFKPKFAHIILFKRLQHSIQGFASLDDFGSCIAYALAHTQKDVRNKIMTEVTGGRIVDAAYQFIIDKEIKPETIDEVLEKLAYKVLNISTDDEEEVNDEDTKEDEKKK